MSGEYYRIQQEHQIEQELKWLEAEAQYVQRESNKLPKKSKVPLPSQGKRDHNKVPKS